MVVIKRDREGGGREGRREKWWRERERGSEREGDRERERRGRERKRGERG